MGKEIRYETTLTWRCEGCGREEIRSNDKPQSSYVDERTLPEGWFALVISEGRDREFLRCYNWFPGYDHHTTPYVLKLEPGSMGLEGSKDAEPPLPKVICCHLCKKKLFDLFRMKSEVPPKPEGPEGDGAKPSERERRPDLLLPPVVDTARLAVHRYGSGLCRIERAGDRKVEQPAPFPKVRFWVRPWVSGVFGLLWLSAIVTGLFLMIDNEIGSGRFAAGVGLVTLTLGALFLGLMPRPGGK